MLSVQVFASVQVFPHICMCLCILFVPAGVAGRLNVMPVNSEALYTSIYFPLSWKFTLYARQSTDWST
jgi:hypothetical protein